MKQMRFRKNWENCNKLKVANKWVKVQQPGGECYIYIYETATVVLLEAVVYIATIPFTDLFIPLTDLYSRPPCLVPLSL